MLLSIVGQSRIKKVVNLFYISKQLFQAFLELFWHGQVIASKNRISLKLIFPWRMFYCFPLSGIPTQFILTCFKKMFRHCQVQVHKWIHRSEYQTDRCSRNQSYIQILGLCWGICLVERECRSVSWFSKNKIGKANKNSYSAQWNWY